MLKRVATAVAIAAGGVAAFFTTRFSGGLIASQLSDPVLSGWLWPAVPAIICVGLLVVATAITGLLMGSIDSHGMDSIAGYDTHRLLGVAGLYGTGAALLPPTVEILLSATVLPPTIGSLTPLVSSALAAAPIVTISIVLWAEPNEVSLDDEDNETEFDPEYVKQATKRGDIHAISDLASTNEASKRDPTGGGSSDQRGTHDIDYAELDYDWQNETGVCFDDVGGLSNVKSKLQREVILPLTASERAADLGVTPSNILFYGPPGTGKTYLARALSSELDYPAVILTGSAINSKWINESAEQVHTLFNEAQSIAAAEGGAIIFVDEVDSVLKQRAGKGDAHAEDTKVVNEFLGHLENTGEYNIVFIGATNRLESIDVAGMRAGRIDEKIEIGQPDRASRAKILRAQLVERPHTVPDRLIADVAAETEGYVAADLEQLVTRAAKRALQREDNVIRQEDIVSAMPE